jgi:hypothetical protein
MGDGSGEHKTGVIGWRRFPCAALAYCFGPPPSSVTARSVFLALVVAWLSRILSWVWGAPSNSDAGGGAFCIHKHCGFNPMMNPAAALPNGGCQPCCLVCVWSIPVYS